MANVASPGEFCAALGLYFGDGAGERYHPGDAIEGTKRIRDTFPESAEVLIAEIDTLLQTARRLPGLWGDGALPLEEACQSIDKFLETEYAFVPATLRRKIVNALEL
ncbi:MAG: hypothetical protein ACT4OO_02095 [Nitrospiraceae bacterium]